MKKLFICILFGIVLAGSVSVSASGQLPDEESFTKVEQILEKQDMEVSYEQIVKYLMKGKIAKAFTLIRKSFTQKLFGELVVNKKFLKQILVVAMAAAAFKNLGDSFFQGSTGSVAFYTSYVVLAGLLTDSFYYLNETAQNLVVLILDYMKGMITAYSIAVVSVSGISTSTAMYEGYLMLIYLMSLMTKSFLLPLIRWLFVIKIINHISEEEHFSRLCKTLEWGTGFLMKGFLAVVLGVQMIQAMILPALDSLKGTAFQKGISAIPGIGAGAGSVMTAVIGSAVVIKNSIGAAGILILVLLIVPPLIQISGVVLSYMGAGILLQPISDRRITGAMDAVIQSGKLMLQMIVTMAVLFILSIALIAFSTNANYYAG